MKSIHRHEGQYIISIPRADTEVVKRFTEQFFQAVPLFKTHGDLRFLLPVEPELTDLLKNFGKENGFEMNMEIEPSNVFNSVPSKHK